MLSSFPRYFSVTTLASLTILAACLPPSLSELHVKASLPAGGYCESVQIPAPWLMSDKYEVIKSDTGVVGPEGDDYFCFRHLTNGLIGVAVQAGMARAMEKTIYSQNAFAYRLEDPKRIRAISRSEWDAGTPIDLVRTDTFKLGIRDYHNRGHSYTYNGVGYTGSGKYLAGYDEIALLSPAHQWLAVQSYDTESESPAPELANAGTLYVDVFNTQTARDLFTVKLEFRNAHAGVLAEKTGWLTDSVLFIDDTDHREGFILCHAGK